MQKVSTSMPETNLLWPKNQLSLEGLFIKSWFSLGFGHLPVQVWWSWQIPLFLLEYQQTVMWLTCLAYLGLYLFGRIVYFWGFKYSRTRSAPSVVAPSPFLCLSLEKYSKLTVFLGLAGKWSTCYKFLLYNSWESLLYYGYSRVLTELWLLLQWYDKLLAFMGAAKSKFLKSMCRDRQIV